MPVAKDLTELVAVNPKRVDRVKSPANGFPVLILKSAAKDVDKKGNVNEAPDISNAEAVLRLLAQLIESEAREMGAGNWDEVCDIEMLSDAARTMKYFRCREQMSADGESIYKSLESAISARAAELGVTSPMNESASKESDVTNDNDPSTSPAPTNTPDTPVEKSTEDLVAEAVSKAISPFQETIKGLESELAAFKAMPNTAGAPVITAAKSAAHTSKPSDADAARFERLAKTVSDRELARYYAERAAEAREASK